MRRLNSSYDGIRFRNGTSWHRGNPVLGILSKQYHHHRDELWVILDDGIIVEIDDETMLAKKGDEFFIPKGTVHRVSSEKGGRFMEIAFGDFDEKDIVRLDDKYGRTGKS